MKLWFERGAWASKRARRKINRLTPESIKSIAVIRHAALGDMVLVRAFIGELRRHFPNAAITLSLVSNYTYGAPGDMVDRVHVIYGSDQRDISIRQQISRIRELGYHDLLFDLAATSRSFWVCWLNRAGLKIGFPYRTLQRSLYYDLTVLRSDFKFEAELMLDMLNLLGCKTLYPPNFNLQVKAEVHDKPYIVYFTSSSTRDKCWPADRFIQLISDMANKYPGHDHLVLEGTADWESVNEIMSSLSGYENVCALNAQALDKTMSLLKGAQLLVSNDTGIRNLAIATETPTLGIFFSTVPYRYWPRYGRHDVVFEYDGTIPSVERVAEQMITLLDETSI